jgi:hypothetical protein
MATRMFALVNGLFYTTIGVLACLPPFLWPPERPHLDMTDLHWGGGFVGGFVMVNLPHNILWIIMGIGGILAAVHFASAKLYGQGVFIVTTMALLWGLLPLGIGDLWGYLPLSGWNVLIHFVTATLAWYYGFVYPRDVAMGIAR